MAEKQKFWSDGLDMVFTCKLLQCVIHCPCSICNDKRENCKMQCKSEVCEGCNSQCSRHQLKLPRTFHPVRDHFTMVTHRLDGYLYAIPHAGIPTDCTVCTRDMVEHQTLHLVFHMRCRFCRHQMRPYEQQHILKMEDYKDAIKILACMQVFVQRQVCQEAA